MLKWVSFRTSNESLLGAKLFPQLHIPPLDFLNLLFGLLRLLQLALLEQNQILSLAVVRVKSLLVIYVLNGGKITLKALRNLPSQYLTLSKLRYPQYDPSKVETALPL